MRNGWLFTSDIQTSQENIHLCEQVAKQIIHLTRKFSLEGVVIGGDCKNSYSPVAVTVTNFWVCFIQKLVTNKLKVVIDLGNHDRISLHTDTNNWFPALIAAGALAFDTPGIVEGSGERIFLLPFCNTVKKLKEGSDYLLSQGPNRNRDVLVFHSDMKGAFYNVGTSSREERITPALIHTDRYKYCLGGHIHLPHRFCVNGHYIGSPFASDWGEVNQKKRFLVVKEGKLISVPSKIPGWFDPSIPRFYTPHSWAGTKIRLKVSIPDGEDYQTLLKIAELEAQKKYPGAQIKTVPEFKSAAVVAPKIQFHDPDHIKIAQYVKETLTGARSVDAEQVIAYLCQKIGAKQTLSRGEGGARFKSARGEWFLPFEKVELKLENQGLKVITGDNQDWGGNNGSGKSSLIDIPPVALFGRTLKEQSHDAWAFDKNEEPALAELIFDDPSGREIVVRRYRRPSGLQLFVDGKDHSSGIRGADTQKQIENLCGLSWETFIAGIYLDEATISSFVNGTPKQRKELLNRFQNLERFELALKEIKGDKANAEEARDSIFSALEQAKQGIIHCGEVLESTESNEEIVNSVRKRKSKILAELKLLDERRRSLYQQSSESITEKREETSRIHYDIASTTTEIYSLKKTISQTGGLKGRCPTCLQPINIKTIGQHVAEWKEELAQKNLFLAELQRRYNLSGNELQQMERQSSNADKVQAELRHKQTELKEVQDNLIDWEKKLQQEVALRVKYENKKREYEEARRVHTQALKNCSADIEFYEYCESVFSRDGLPAYLNEQLVPMLNKAAEYYSELFSDSEIQVKFSSQEGEFDIAVLNIHGGRTFDAQSAGEKRMASLIACFALRDILPSYNLLILDEPGENLDTKNSRKFAEGIVKLKEKFETILLTTHSSVLLSHLAVEDVIIVRKKDGVSKII
jgi:DNA repair exonuclease SbcCD ATPase subunit/Icc-related predicted phosphoesterase